MPKELPKQPPRSKLAEGCVLAMDFEAEASWGAGKMILKDLSGKRNDGTGIGTGLLKDKGRFGAGLSFDGVGNYAEFPALQEKTISMWVFLNPSVRQDQQGAVLYDGGTNEEGAGRARLIGIMRPGGWNAQDAPYRDSYGIFAGFWFHDAAAPAPDLGQGWHHVVMAWDGRNVWIQIDGRRPRGKSGTYNDMRESAQPLQLPQVPIDDGGTTTLLGHHRHKMPTRWADRDFFSGMLDDVAAWDRALSEDEMQELWKVSSSGKSYVEMLKATK
jgi:hypothetical protein